MITVVTNERNNDQVVKCLTCGTELGYDLADLRYGPSIQGRVDKYITCCVCQAVVYVVVC